MSASNATTAMLYQTLFTTLMQVNYTIFPDGDGVPHLVKLDDDPLTPEEITAVEDRVKTVTFTLYTRKNSPAGQVITVNNPGSISRSDWNAKRKTIFTTHGWKSAGDKEACTDVRDAYLKIYDCNVIVIDWGSVASDDYSKVAKIVPIVALYVSDFITFMRESGSLDTHQMKLVGHSLGAHVVSLAARVVKQSSLVAEVIALDPARPLFEGTAPDRRVDRSHADYVQVVHTSAKKLGFEAAVGTSDFYANGGKQQPGCGIDFLGECAHSRSYEFYSESVGHPKGFPGKSKGGGAVEAFMGGPVLDSKARGFQFDFTTRDKKPYSTVPLAE